MRFLLDGLASLMLEVFIDNSTITITFEMASPTKPTVILLQGTFQPPEVYHSFARLISSRGFPVVQPAYPSLTGQDQPDFINKTLADDVQVVEDVVKKLVDDEGKAVLVVMHSYGGLVGAEAVPEDLNLKHRQAKGGQLLPGGVAYLFYFSAFVLPMGQSIATAMGDHPDHDHYDGRFSMRDPLATLYTDMPADEAAYWARRTIPQSNAVKDTAMRRCAYAYVPSTYVVCTGDKAVPPPVQKMFAQLAGAVVREIDTGHSAMLSKLDEVMALLEEAAAAM
ncbi:Uu.00g127940.m01.CDS01 [Anthostomella pinea]|uniref:Uu.00g127940.m01.CDS01 n=1 Tax=Anthostomella pinea TaxID=933095 RepID=A0AAI8YHU3_9PEZI|nr:Uu.00g127940.m01.CDS01 [Anthostomella pinea]